MLTAMTATAPVNQGELDSPAESVISRRQMNLVFVTVLIAMLLSALDQTIVATALPTIVGDLGGGHLSWVVSAYLLADTISTVLAGRLSDQFGRKAILQVSAAIFVIASAACGFAHSMIWLISWRGIQGLGAGGLAVAASAVIADVIPVRDRARYQGALGAVFGVALVLGPLLGGFFTGHLSWRWVFLVNLPLGALVMAMTARTIPSIPRGGKSNIDYAGIGFVSAGAAALVLALSWGGTDYAWDSTTVIGLFIGAAIALVCFVLVESRAAEPILPLRLFRSPIFSVCVILAFIVGFTMLGALTFLPTYSQYVKGISPTASGVRTLPLVVGLLATSMLAGSVVSKTGRYKMFPVVGSLLMALGLWMLSRLTPDTGYWTLALDMLVFGAGVGSSMQILTTIVQSTSDFGDLGVATAGVGFLRTLGSSFGTAIFGTIFTSALSARLAAAVVASHGVPPSAVTSPEALHHYPTAQITPILNAYSHALHVLFLAAVPVALVATLTALFLKRTPLRGTAQAGATDVGDGFGVPVGPDRVAQLEQAISRIIRSAGPDDRLAIARQTGTQLDAASAWAVGIVAGRTALGLDTDLRSISRRYQVPAAVLRPAFDAAGVAGWLSTTDDQLAVTEAGRTELNQLAAGARAWLTDKLADWHAEDDPAFTAALRHIALELVA
jgi:EmrB/QacA subfamily drug resistance transporter